MPSEPSTGTRRSSESSAPIMNSASAWAVAVKLRTTSTSARWQASRSMFSAPALTRPTACRTGAKCNAWASSVTDEGTIIARTL